MGQEQELQTHQNSKMGKRNIEEHTAGTREGTGGVKSSPGEGKERRHDGLPGIRQEGLPGIRQEG